MRHMMCIRVVSKAPGKGTCMYELPPVIELFDTLWQGVVCTCVMNFQRGLLELKSCDGHAYMDEQDLQLKQDTERALPYGCI